MLLGETPGAAWCGLRVPMAGGQAGACSSPGRRLARLGPCRVPYTLLVKGSSVILGARIGVLVTLTESSHRAPRSTGMQSLDQKASSCLRVKTLARE